MEILGHGYDYERSRETPWRLAGYLLTHPHKIFRLKRFVEPLAGVRKKLTRFLVELVKNL